MQICKDHWAKLRARIEELGLSHLVAQSGEDAHRQVVDELEGRKDEKAFDPLMSCNWMICNNAIRLGGIHLLMAKPDGSSLCPICEAWEHRHDGARPEDEPVTLEWFENYWITGPTDAALVHARNLGLVPVQQ